MWDSLYHQRQSYKPGHNVGTEDWTEDLGTPRKFFQVRRLPCIA